jgi:hypothetical protein
MIRSLFCLRNNLKSNDSIVIILNYITASFIDMGVCLTHDIFRMAGGLSSQRPQIILLLKRVCL